MKRWVVQAACLLALTWWVSGAALYVHHVVEHAGHAHAHGHHDADAHHGHDHGHHHHHSESTAPGDEPAPKDSHDDCSECLMLASLRAATPDAPNQLCDSLLPIDRVVDAACVVDAIAPLGPQPARGPPA